jgi:hypothetical protein
LPYQGQFSREDNGGSLFLLRMLRPTYEPLLVAGANAHDLCSNMAAQYLRLLRYDLSGSSTLEETLGVKMPQVTSGTRVSIRSVADGVAASHNGDSVFIDGQRRVADA